MKNITIAIPVYTAIEQTINCVNSILNSDASSCRVILLDDASPGGVADLVEIASAHKNVELVSHIRNRGYTRNIQIGVDLAKTEYVCILNSDTMVPSAWCEKLVSILVHNPLLAGVGPLSNAASYQSIPEIKNERDGFSKNDNFGQAYLIRDQLNVVLNRLFGHDTIDVPILNGFCTLFRKSALTQVNGFDINMFPAGYGEENDLCIRLRGAGYRLAVVPSVFVYHEKSQSFGEERKAHLSRIGADVLKNLYGDYHVPDLAKQLDKHIALRAVRKIGKILNKLVSDNIDLECSLKKLPAGNCIAFCQEGKIQKMSTHISKHGQIEYGRDGMLVLHTPHDSDMYWFDGYSYQTLTALLAYRSTIEPVLFNIFYNHEERNNNVQTKWLLDLEFDRLFDGSVKLRVA